MYLAGESADEVLISTHACHPSLCNDNLSGVAVAAFLARTIAALPQAALVPLPVRSGHDRRDRLAPREPGHGVDGSSTGSSWPASATRAASRTSGRRRGDAEIDRAVAHVLRESGDDYELARLLARSATTSGSTARPASTCPSAASCGRRPGGSPSTTPRRTTSTSSTRRASPTRFGKLLAALSVVDGDGTYVNLNPMCEPQLGRRGLLPRGRRPEGGQRRARKRCSGC